MPARSELARRSRAEVDAFDDARAGSLELIGDREPAVVGGHDHRPLARLQRPLVDESPRRLRQADADEVVAGEHERLLERSRCDDDPLCAEAIQDTAGVDGNETALVDPDRSRGGEHLEVAVYTGSATLVDEHHLPARGGGGAGCLTP